MNKLWEHPTISTERGPRCVEVPYVLNNLRDGSVFEIGGNNSLFKWAIVRRDVKYTVIDPLGTQFLGSKNLEKVSCLKGDIRKRAAEDLGEYNNVLLVSVLEHIGLSAYEQTPDWKKWESIQACQLDAFRHCMNFVKENGGRMICTLPFGDPPEEDKGKGYESPDFLLRYKRDMLNDLYKGYKLIDESFYILSKPTHLLRWKKVNEAETLNHRSNVCFVLER